MHKKALEKDVILKLKSDVLVSLRDSSRCLPKYKLHEFRHVQDLRKQNKDIESIAWPLLNQDELIYKIVQSLNASKLYLISAFDQTRIHLDDEKYATIINYMQR